MKRLRVEIIWLYHILVNRIKALGTKNYNSQLLITSYIIMNCHPYGIHWNLLIEPYFWHFVSYPHPRWHNAF